MEILKKFFQPIVAAISLVALFFFPFVDCNFGFGIGSDFSGFTMAMNTYIGFLLILLPIVMVATPFVPKWDIKKDVFSILLPALCLVSWILTVIFAKTFVSEVANSSLASGAYITLICYVVLLAHGCLTNKELVKSLIDNIKGKK